MDMEYNIGDDIPMVMPKPNFYDELVMVVKECVQKRKKAADLIEKEKASIAFFAGIEVELWYEMNPPCRRWRTAPCAITDSNDPEKMWDVTKATN